MSLRAILIDDHNIMRQGLRILLEQQPHIEVVGEAENGRAGVQLTRESVPDIVIMDVAMPDLNGIEATRQIVTEIPGPRVIGLSMHADRRFVVEMLRAGARGYLLKMSAFEELLIAIETVMANDPYLSPIISQTVLSDYLHHLPADDSTIFELLTPREREVLQLIAEGHTNREIADILCISIKTVDTHRQQIMGKLNARNVASLIRFAIREGIVGLN